MSELQDLLDRLDGAQLPFHEKSGTDVRCDSCSDVINPNRPAGLWLTNRDIRGVDKGRLDVYRIHCESCIPPERVYQKLAPKWWFELVIDVTIGEDAHMHDLSVKYYSKPSDGVPYDPIELHDETFGFKGKRERTADAFDGPYDVIDVLIWATIDPRDVLDEDGVKDISDEQQAEHRNLLIEEFQRKGDMDRVKQFWKHVAEHGDEHYIIEE